jgi:hypothetical protein
MKKQYLITREQLDRVVANFLDDKMRGGRVKTVRNRFSKSSLLNAFITPGNEVLFIIFEWGESWDWDDKDIGPRSILSIDEGLVDMLSKHVGIRKHKAMDIISDWFEDTYDFDFSKVDTSKSLRNVIDGWEK